MPDRQPITIVGGGLAGLTLGIALRRREIPVDLWEAGAYPCHRVCGEFISGRGQQVLERLDLQAGLFAAGARWARTMAFHADGRVIASQPLPRPALCLSRYVLDDLLAREFRNLGGVLREKQRWPRGYGDEGVVRASGRRAQTDTRRWRWFGLKVHAHGVKMLADLELHFRPDGYVGLCRLHDEVNICGLFRCRTPIPDLKQRWQQVLCGEEDSPFYAYLAGATLDKHSFCATAGLGMEPHGKSEEGTCALGDALTMIPPFTGNGMSMALEGAELAVDPLTRYSRGEIEWPQARRDIARACHQRFATRLRAATLLHKIIFYSTGRRLLPPLLARFPSMSGWLFDQTR